MEPEERTVYMLETAYLKEGLELWAPVERVAEALLPWARAYEARLILPRRDTAPAERAGPLPEDVGERQALLRQVLAWIRESSECSDCFVLRLLGREEGEQPLFEFHDLPHDWSLFLTAHQWEAVQAALREAGLPDDLFFEADRMRCVPWPGTRWRDRLLRRLGVQRCFTPREWRKQFGEEE